jgi:hypothetical protein
MANHRKPLREACTYTTIRKQSDAPLGGSRRPNAPWVIPLLACKPLIQHNMIVRLPSRTSHLAADVRDCHGRSDGGIDAIDNIDTIDRPLAFLGGILLFSRKNESVPGNLFRDIAMRGRP